MDPNAPTGLPVGWINTAAAALAGAVVWMAKEILRRQKKTEKDLEACEEKHEATQGALLSLKDEVGDLKGEVGELRGQRDLTRALLERLDGD